ncbi:MAG: hypothetical protein COY69_02295 [Candidatus Magasanikbacteria bacterium CG_4_10_14_0_8_um_filter_32_14]|uniref:Integrase n=1 Tax=Candidatus Magasanikbacteria bacterium CG_4_10_14_0_8_um_filter_32_14 TaxID=1974640 RepID=A0A2M7R9S0_9BACT|nr:MAG: hypothetical protein COY69_02295 [Candidatus Magasanikbacteria bacterium CG_4_10_14_0_8_um_filter_32_14]
MKINSILQKIKKEMMTNKYSENTITSYLFYIKKYLVFLNNKKLNLATDTTQFFLKFQKQNKISPQTYNLILNALNFFYNKVGKQTNKVNIKYQSLSTKKPLTLTPKQIKKIIDCIHNPKHLFIISLAYGSGLRLNEIKNLRIKDLNLENLTIQVRNKQGKKVRETIIAEKIKRELQSFINNKKPTDLLFTNHTGHQLSDRAIQSAFSSALARAKITKSATFQSLRYSFIKHLLENGVAIHHIQKLLGHKNIRTTKLYQKNVTTEITNIKSPL